MTREALIDDLERILRDAGTTVVQEGDCVSIPRKAGEQARVCCGQLCSDTATPCLVNVTCNRLINLDGVELKPGPYLLDCEG